MRWNRLRTATLSTEQRRFAAGGVNLRESARRHSVLSVSPVGKKGEFEASQQRGVFLIRHQLRSLTRVFPPVQSPGASSEAVVLPSASPAGASASWRPARLPSIHYLTFQTTLSLSIPALILLSSFNSVCHIQCLLFWINPRHPSNFIASAVLPIQPPALQLRPSLSTPSILFPSLPRIKPMLGEMQSDKGRTSNLAGRRFPGEWRAVLLPCGDECVDYERSKKDFKQWTCGAKVCRDTKGETMIGIQCSCCNFFF